MQGHVLKLNEVSNFNPGQSRNAYFSKVKLNQPFSGLKADMEG